MIKAIIEKLKKKQVMGIVFWSALIITILPYEIIYYIRLDGIREKYQMYISLILITISAYYISNISNISNISAIIDVFLMRKVDNEKKFAIKYIKSQMSTDEMELIIETFYDDSNNTFKSYGHIERSDERKVALESKGIIYLAPNKCSMEYYGYYGLAYKLQPDVREFLNNKLK